MPRDKIFDERHKSCIRFMVQQLHYSDGMVAKIMLTERRNIGRAREELGLEANYRKGSRATKRVLDFHKLS